LALGGRMACVFWVVEELIVIHRGNRDDGEETFVEWVKCG
jgi:hypothetical protein